MKYSHVLLVMVKALFSCSEIETNINTSSVKGSGKDEIGTNFLNSDIYDQFQPVHACDH